MDHNEKIASHHKKIDEIVNSQEYKNGGNVVSAEDIKTILLDITDYAINDELRKNVKLSSKGPGEEIFPNSLESVKKIITNFNSASRLLERVRSYFIKDRKVLSEDDKTLHEAIGEMKMIRFRAVTIRKIIIGTYLPEITPLHYLE